MEYEFYCRKETSPLVGSRAMVGRLAPRRCVCALLSATHKHTYDVKYFRLQILALIRLSWASSRISSISFFLILCSYIYTHGAYIYVCYREDERGLWDFKGILIMIISEYIKV